MSDLELRKYCLEKALSVNSAQPGNFTVLAESFLDFLTKPEPNYITAKPATMDSPIKGFKLLELSPICRAYLKVVIQMYHRGDTVNGAAVAREMKNSQPTAGKHLKKLVKQGYIRRYGNKYQPIFGPTGEAVPAIVQQQPTAAAKGYKGQKSGHVTPLRKAS